MKSSNLRRGATFLIGYQAIMGWCDSLSYIFPLDIFPRTFSSLNGQKYSIPARIARLGHSTFFYVSIEIVLSALFSVVLFRLKTSNKAKQSEDETYDLPSTQVKKSQVNTSDSATGQVDLEPVVIVEQLVTKKSVVNEIAKTTSLDNLEATKLYDAAPIELREGLDPSVVARTVIFHALFTGKLKSEIEKPKPVSPKPQSTRQVNSTTNKKNPKPAADNWRLRVYPEFSALASQISSELVLFSTKMMDEYLPSRLDIRSPSFMAAPSTVVEAYTNRVKEIGQKISNEQNRLSEICMRFAGNGGLYDQSDFEALIESIYSTTVELSHRLI